MTKTLITMLVAAVLLFAPGPASAMQPDDSPRPAPAVQVTTTGGKIVPYTCMYRPEHADRLELTTQAAWVDWIEKLSGHEPVTLNGNTYTITNRHSFALFNRAELDYAQSHGFEYLLETVRKWYPESQIEIDPYTVQFGFPSQMYTWKNLIVTIPGRRLPNDVVMLTAHYDSTNGPATMKPAAGTIAPGANDNGSGSASLLEAARILKDAPLDRTVRLIWFTGEEQGLRGSGAYVQDHNLSNVVGVINLDMFAYDSDNDRCFELHVSNPSYGTAAVAPSERIGACFVEIIDAYEFDLNYDFHTGIGTTSSDHSNFWLKGVGAIEVLENYYGFYTQGGCYLSDMSPHYHKATDLVENINSDTAFDIHRAALATLFSMGTVEHIYYMPGIYHQ